MNFKDVTDYDIQAYIDNELDHETEKVVRHYIEHTTQARERYKELKRQKTSLISWWKDSRQ